MKIFNNEIEQYDTGVFTSDRNGLLFENYLHDNLVWGLFFCAFPPASELPDGNIPQAAETTNNWVIAKNICNNCGTGGYGLIDGAFENRLVANQAEGSIVADIILHPELIIPGFDVPSARDNLIISAQLPDVTIMDCGDNNTIIGGTLVDCTL